MPPKVISGGDNPYDIHDAKLSSSATAHESSSVTAHEISNNMDSSHKRKALFFLVQKISLVCYPFRPEVLIPSTRYFWKNRKMITAGKTARLPSFSPSPRD